ncbi:MAG: SurA N-terminal domain-containing protein [Epsilonproteobacteria bacterium]|nr:SurA N-terminal domain-containing protein [Campylobacterota bacterium]
MITWMQHHRKYLVVTIWISTIAFIGAGFVGWGQYSYGDKASAVAQVGDVSITAEELQRTYSNLFNQYNQLFQGKLDEKQAQQFGLQRQALKTLVDQALIINLAQSYRITVSDQELFNLIKNQQAFHKGGSFDKEMYAAVLGQNHLTIKEYEEAMRKELLIQKTLYLFTPVARTLETNTIASAQGVADKIEYKLLTPDAVTIASDEAGVKAYWEKHQNEFKKEASYDLSIIHMGPEATQNDALRRYIDFKKGTIDPSVNITKTNVSTQNNLFTPEVFKEITELTTQKPFLKPRKVGNEFVILKLDAFNPAARKTYEEAKAEANSGYVNEMKKSKLQALAQNSYKTFSGNVSDFIMHTQTTPLSGLTAAESAEFIEKLFATKQKQGFLTLKSGNVILYNVLEQKLLQDKAVAEENTAMKLKGNLLNQKLMKMLESKYPVKIYAEGI